mmetsp:Transcript_1196/g.2884  ORF Transcript_1196/g.2884 Transcript_1196/m.2884 type:complete len:435 (-) Transcript_1196:367-1671(-)|eukprot:CAMPEP_0171484536 /NCGR_PEP_ID=MMETSP0958-20121227/56_1 /TAXON_ID=87120 /ORGANISM="Aurantiochytrium limacinum, Strain ATCCMYA-1381" /LENGTH=434 /DNA_ID=CAMNT_0012017249 /DNA_START=144 /DNA_END=1448 /DNA_ORIENTATION=-
MTAMEDLFGEELIAKDGSRVKTRDVTKKVMAIYASSATCGPCRLFTPMLAKLYEKLNKDGKELEIIFLSADDEKDGFDECYAKMPWLAVPFDDEDRKISLMKKIKLRAVPTLVFFDGESGEMYNMNGREAIAADEEGENYPWTPPSLKECLGSSFINGDGEEVTLEDLKGKYITLYFSAQWCPPCHMFTPVLIKLYKKLKEEGKPWEVIFLSSDRDQGAFEEYFASMPWLSVPFEDRGRKQKLSTYFDVEGIPTAIMLDPELNVINKGLRGYIDEDQDEGKNFPWEPKPVLTLTQGAGEINDMPNLVVLMEQEGDNTQAQFETILTQISESHAEKVKSENKPPMQFLVANPGDMLVSRVRSLCGLASAKDEFRTLCNGDMCMRLHASTAVIILDIPDQGGFYELEGELTKENIVDFYEKFIKGELKSSRKQLGA